MALGHGPVSGQPTCATPDDARAKPLEALSAEEVGDQAPTDADLAALCYRPDAALVASDSVSSHEHRRVRARRR
ncbi:MAG: hypothetical protein RIM84_21000 [Alphaproteobacteria bacterium]